MVEVIHEHETHDGSSSGMGFLLGIIALLLFLYMLFAFGLPALRGGASSGTANPQINVPSEGKLDVNVNQGGGQ